MATQGVVSILRGGRVIMKIVVGCNGYSAEKLAEALEKLPAPTVDDAVRLSDDFDFGCHICRVIVAELPGDSPEITRLAISSATATLIFTARPSTCRNSTRA